jgi:hypothetical protein
MPTPIDTTKVYSNGHKTFGAMEALGFQQQLKREITTQEYFVRNKEIMIRPRNPLTGEPTPRDGLGEPIINPNWEPSPVKEKKEVSAKIGIKHSKYDILGNSDEKREDKTEPLRSRIF